MGTRGKFPRPDTSLSDHSASSATSSTDGGSWSSIDESSASLRDATIVKLRSALEAEQTLMRQLRRERAVEVKEVTEREGNKASIALKDLKLRLMQEKSAELEKLKEAMNRKFEADAAKMARQKEAEVNKLRDALVKCQAKSSRAAKETGLSGAQARANSFEGERANLARELQDARACKKELELALRSAERQRRHDLDRANQGHTAELARIKRESENEVRKLVSRNLIESPLNTSRNACNVTSNGTDILKYEKMTTKPAITHNAK